MTDMRDLKDGSRRMRDFYGLSVGDRVCAHGEGFGRVVSMTEGRYLSEDRIAVEIPHREHHERSGKVIEWVETVHRHPNHVSRSAS